MPASQATRPPAAHLQAIWQQNARNWRFIGPPLRPQAEDLAFIECALAAVRPDSRAGTRVVLLGVTPEIARLRRPERSTLIALDHNPHMIRRIWPGSELSVPASAVLSDWRAMPIASGTCDAVLGDGYHPLLGHPDRVLALGAEIRRVLNRRGRHVLRAFVRPARPEHPAAVFEDLAAGRIANFHVFKWRLAMSLHGGLNDGVRLGAVWDAWHRAVPDARELSRRLGWDDRVIATIDAYQGSEARYLFPTLGELRTLLAEHFIELECRVPGYALGERCPSFVLEARPDRETR
jgi:hypothetical protein